MLLLTLVISLRPRHPMAAKNSLGGYCETIKKEASRPLFSHLKVYIA
jgi:hypothetical protein